LAKKLHCPLQDAVISSTYQTNKTPAFVHQASGSTVQKKRWIAQLVCLQWYKHGVFGLQFALLVGEVNAR
jgi:hypothetical protein